MKNILCNIIYNMLSENFSKEENNFCKIIDSKLYSNITKLQTGAKNSPIIYAVFS